MGLRADESAARARKTPWKRSDRNSRAGRSWFDWLPIFDLSTDDVFRIIHDAGQSPHWAYAAGMSRLSCSFCILASRSDLRRAAELRPDLYRAYTELEQRIGQPRVDLLRGQIAMGRAGHGAAREVERLLARRSGAAQLARLQHRE